MDVIISQKLEEIPEKALAIATQENSLLNFLYCLDFEKPHWVLPSLLAKYHQLEGEWIALVPIHWQATHNDAFIAAWGEQLSLTSQEAQEWYQLLADFISQDGIQLYFHDINFWLMSCKPHPSGATKSLVEMKNSPMLPELEKLDNSFKWQKLLTEIQMLFSASPLNQQRQNEGKPVINGVWVFNGGINFQLKNKKVCVSPEWLPLAKLCAENIEVYSPTVDLQGFDVVLLNDFVSLTEKQKQQLETKGKRWFWHNHAYTKPKLSFWASIWRYITHAHKTTHPT